MDLNLLLIHSIKAMILNRLFFGWDIMRPIFTHDCDECIFLKSITIKKIIYDLYFHNTKIEKTIIARFGNEGFQYLSGLEFGQYSYKRHLKKEPLFIAYETAIELGYLSPKMDIF